MAVLVDYCISSGGAGNCTGHRSSWEDFLPSGGVPLATVQQ